MRLRFGQPSLTLLILFAVFVGVVFYIFDNRPTQTPSSSSMMATPEVLASPFPAATLASGEEQQSASPTQTILPETSIFVPRAGIASRVIEAFLDGVSWDVSQLRTNVGHLEGTARVGEPGNVVLSGHVELSNGRPGVFANLIELQINDLIVITHQGTEIRYLVTEIYATSPDDLTPLMPAIQDRLTLITCGSYSILSDSYLERTIVVAEPVG